MNAVSARRLVKACAMAAHEPGSCHGIESGPGQQTNCQSIGLVFEFARQRRSARIASIAPGLPLKHRQLGPVIEDRMSQFVRKDKGKVFVRQAPRPFLAKLDQLAIGACKPGPTGNDLKSDSASRNRKHGNLLGFSRPDNRKPNRSLRRQRNQRGFRLVASGSIAAICNFRSNQLLAVDRDQFITRFKPGENRRAL